MSSSSTTSDELVQPNGRGLSSHSDNDVNRSLSDFLRKLFKMLQDPSFGSTICWCPSGDAFIIKDVNEFTDTVLPRMFHHSNFASFVRQLNKYNFRKLRKYDGVLEVERGCVYRHPDFQADRPDLLFNIKRQLSTEQKNRIQIPDSDSALEYHDLYIIPPGPESSRSPTPTSSISEPSSPMISSIQSQVDKLVQNHADMERNVDRLQTFYLSNIKRLADAQVAFSKMPPPGEQVDEQDYDSFAGSIEQYNSSAKGQATDNGQLGNDLLLGNFPCTTEYDHLLPLLSEQSYFYGMGSPF